MSPLKPGTLYGEVAIMLDLPRSASVQARTDVKLLALEKEDFREVVAGSLGLSVDFDEVIRGRLDKLAGALARNGVDAACRRHKVQVIKV